MPCQKRLKSMLSSFLSSSVSALLSFMLCSVLCMNRESTWVDHCTVWPQSAVDERASVFLLYSGLSSNKGIGLQLFRGTTAAVWKVESRSMCQDS